MYTEFIEQNQGQLFTSRSQKQRKSDCVTLFFPPFTGEMNKSRHLLHRVASAQQLVAEGLQAVDTLYQLNQATDYTARMMNNAQLQQLPVLGVTIGAHTHNHPILKRLDTEAQQIEIAHNKNLLEQIQQQPLEHFAYPNGVEGRDFDDVALKLAAGAGFKSTVMTNWGYSTANTPVHRLKRFTPCEQQPMKFHLRLIKNCLS